MAKNTTQKNSLNEAASPELAFAKTRLGKALLEMLSEGSNSYQSIANFLLRNHVRVTAMGIEELAASCEVSTATISRFARDVGFNNYAAMRNEVAETLQNLFQPVEKLRNTIERRNHATTPSTASMEYAIANTDSANQGLSVETLDGVVDVITKARTVYVMGFGLSAHLAAILSLHLQPFCQHVVEVVGYGGTEVAAGHLAQISDKDVLIVISFPRYALDVIKLTHFARDHATSIVSITDSTASPLANLGDYLLLAPSTHPVLPSSSSAAIAVIEALVSKLMVSNKKNVEKAQKLTEALSSYLHGAEVPTAGQKSKRKNE
ncbi:MurR/RpiR family transcriptional regulator [Undibacterium terreum]|uniref:Transcriptional regulator n=1 Tax=Undibacterium terreum TaxID=1224302 RepID=A0A916UQ16_9BURK|nr:MurR/RpiR family transcriptional regulator [Undibacterium terreum]GGC81440.1 transcriptional regulator [Undibacterium terreum]